MFQLEVVDKITQTSYLFNDIVHIPRKGEVSPYSMMKRGTLSWMASLKEFTGQWLKMAILLR